MRKHRSYPIEFKRQAAQEYLAGETCMVWPSATRSIAPGPHLSGQRGEQYRYDYNKDAHCNLQSARRMEFMQFERHCL